MNVSARILWLGLVLALTLSGCSRRDSTPVAEVEKAHNVRVLVLGPRSTVKQEIEISGPVSPVRGTDLAVEEAGVVLHIIRDKGDEVAKGDLILEQERTLLAAELEAAEADLKTREFDLKQMRRLFEAGKISRLELLQNENGHAQAAARVKTARRRFERAALTAPFAGVVVGRFVEPGQYLLPAQKAVRVIDPDTLKLNGFLTERQVGQVAPGQTCRVLMGDSGRVAQGTVGFISCEADLQTGKFPVEVVIPNLERELRSGVIGRARLTGSSVEAVAIPRDVVLSGLTGATVFVVHQGRAVRRSVTLGPGRGLMVAVREGLAPGDTLIVRGQRALRDGNRVAITEWSTAPDGSLPADPQVVRDLDADGGTGQPTARETP